MHLEGAIDGLAGFRGLGGGQVRLGVDVECLYLFDHHTGRSLDAKLLKAGLQRSERRVELREHRPRGGLRSRELSVWHIVLLSLVAIRPAVATPGATFQRGAAGIVVGGSEIHSTAPTFARTHQAR